MSETNQNIQNQKANENSPKVSDDVDGGNPKIQSSRSINSIRIGLKSELHEKRIKVAPVASEEDERCNTVESD